jgi:hypothetical protein
LTKMLFALFILIQSQNPARLSKVVIAGAAIFLILGITLLVYFVRRLRTTEKEPEEDWNLSRRSLFVADSPPLEPATSEHANADAEIADASEPELNEPRATKILASPYRSEPSALENEPAMTEPVALSQSEPELEPETKISEPSTHSPKTQIFASPSLESQEPLETLAQAPARETMPFDDEIWAGLETKMEESAEHIEPAAPRQTTELRSPSINRTSDTERESIAPELIAHERVESEKVEPEEIEPEKVAPERVEPERVAPERVEPERAARVEQRATREFFEPPRVEQMKSREPFEPPTVKPITPREQAEAMRNRQAPPKATRELYAGGAFGEEAANKLSAADTNLYGQPPESASQAERQTTSLYESRATRELAADAGLNAAASDRLEASIAATPANQARERRAPAGAILGLPLEASHSPIVLGNPAKPANEIGIGSLTSYGKSPDQEGGRGGTIALLLAVLIVGGALAAYFFVPSVNSQVKAWVAQARGIDPNAANQSTEPKATLFPFPSEPDKNMVKAKGAINNISSQTLENLELEVSLERGNGGPSEIRNIPIAPSQIEPTGRGTYEFEYDGSRETGFVVYKIKRLLSNGNPIRFSSPALK